MLLRPRLLPTLSPLLRPPTSSRLPPHLVSIRRFHDGPATTKDSPRELHSSPQSHSLDSLTLTLPPLSPPSPLSSPTHELDPGKYPQDLPPSPPPSPSPLSILPLSMILRTLFTTTVSSSNLLLLPSLTILSIVAHSSSRLLHPDHNPIVRFALRHTLYDQFCAGTNGAEVAATVARLKRLGFTGVILNYAREIGLPEAQLRNLQAVTQGAEADACVKNELLPWKEGTLKTIRLAQEGDYVSIKFTGAGQLALYYLSKVLPPPPPMAEALDEICSFAALRGVRLLVDAEQTSLQPGIDEWTLLYSKRYNTDPDRLCIYNTYQTYLKSAARTLRQHLERAQTEGFTLGVKLVRGAYLGSDPRCLIHDTKADTDRTFDTLAASLLRHEWWPLEDAGEKIPGSETAPPFPTVGLVLATHNGDSVRMARALCDRGEARNPVAFAQLQGMADEVSCELIAMSSPSSPTAVQTYKYLAWGTMGECMKYLLRRAQENRDAVQRTRNGRNAMWAELVRRVRRVAGV